MRKWQKEPAGDRRIVRLPDGDALHTYDSAPREWRDQQPVALIVHGLGGSHRSGSVLRLTWELLQKQIRVVRINLRGCGDSMADSRLPYHAGCSADIREVLQLATIWFPQSRLWLVGISLGGNIVLKLAGEGTSQFPFLEKVMAIAPPVDLQHCCDLLKEKQNARYERLFVNELQTLARLRAGRFGESLPVYASSMRLSEFDDQYTAPRCGFADAGDYYRKASSLPLLGAIRIPTHILTAEDDPFVDARLVKQAQLAEHIQLHLTRYGGHLGYISRPGKGGWCWLERFVVDQLLRPN